MATAHAGFWEDMLDLYQWGIGPLGSLSGSHACFQLDVTQRWVEAEDCFLVVAHIDEAVQLDFARSNRYSLRKDFQAVSPIKVLIRASKQDFEATLRHAGKVRLIQASIRLDEEIVILDATAPPSYFATTCTVRQDECVQVAEVFAGGFSGWHRACIGLQTSGVKVHTSWCLEKDAECIEVLTNSHMDMREVGSGEHVDHCTCPSDILLFSDNFNTAAWRVQASHRPVHVMCLSPPCQPWSRAANQAGLMSEDGRLIMQAVDYVKATGVAVVVFEEVEQFPRHPHFRVFYSAMEAANYRCVWRGAAQLAEVAPVHRLRYFLIWVNKDADDPLHQVVPTVWRSLRFPTLNDMDALFACLPMPLLIPCTLQPEVLVDLHGSGFPSA